MKAGCCDNHNFVLKCQLELKFCEVVELDWPHMHEKFWSQRRWFEVVKFGALSLGCVGWMLQ